MSSGILIIHDKENGRSFEFSIPQNPGGTLLEIRKKFLICKTVKAAVRLKDRLLNDDRLCFSGDMESPTVIDHVAFGDQTEYHLKVEVCEETFAVGMVKRTLEDGFEKVKGQRKSKKSLPEDVTTKKTKKKTKKTKKKIDYSPEVLALKETYFSLFKKTPRGRKCNDVAWLKEKISEFKSDDGTTPI